MTDSDSEIRRYMGDVLTSTPISSRMSESFIEVQRTMKLLSRKGLFLRTDPQDLFLSGWNGIIRPGNGIWSTR